MQARPIIHTDLGGNAGTAVLNTRDIRSALFIYSDRAASHYSTMRMMKNMRSFGVVISLLFVTACASSTSRQEYCSLRSEALTSTDDAVRKMTVMLGGRGSLNISDEQRELEFALFAKMLLKEEGIAERFRIAAGLGISEYRMPRVFQRDDEAAVCVEQAQTISEIDECLEHIESWRDTDISNPGSCPKF